MCCVSGAPKKRKENDSGVPGKCDRFGPAVTLRLSPFFQKKDGANIQVIVTVFTVASLYTFRSYFLTRYGRLGFERHDLSTMSREWRILINKNDFSDKSGCVTARIPNRKDETNLGLVIYPTIR